MKFSSVFFSYLETGEIISRAKKNPTDLLRKSLEKQIAIVLWYEKILFFPALSIQSKKKKKSLGMRKSSTNPFFLGHVEQ